MPGILIDCLRKYQRLSQTPLESTRAPVHFLMLGGAGQAVPTIDAYNHPTTPPTMQEKPRNTGRFKALNA